jgi:hypothetical protein
MSGRMRRRSCGGVRRLMLSELCLMRYDEDYVLECYDMVVLDTERVLTC